MYAMQGYQKARAERAAQPNAMNYIPPVISAKVYGGSVKTQPTRRVYSTAKAATYDVNAWHRPSMERNADFEALANEPHILIGGCTGSGKSVFMNTLLYSIIDAPHKTQFVFIDLKVVELSYYRDAPQTMAYCTTVSQTAAALKRVREIIDDRYRRMGDLGIRKWTDAQGSRIYIVIDEYAELITQGRKLVERELMSIAQIGRAAGVHIIAATQRPTRDIITGAVKVNFDCRIALRTATAQDSRNILDRNGAEKLPRFGHAIVMRAGYTETWDVPMTPDWAIEEQINDWVVQAFRANYHPGHIEIDS